VTKSSNGKTDRQIEFVTRVSSRRRFMRRVGGTAALLGIAKFADSCTTVASGNRTGSAEDQYNQALRPQFHFTSRTGWINDPNGLVYDNGIYHMFFQHNPFGNVWGNMTWGHAISHDLVHWRQLQDAITPDRLGTIFSGSAAVDTYNTTGFGRDGRPPVIAMYTAAGGTSSMSKDQPFTQCLAYSNDGGFTFTKYQHNPVIRQIVPGNRDPKIIWFAPTRRWIMPLFLDDKQGFDIFSSPDLKHWAKIQNISFPQVQECPNLFPLPVHGKPGTHRWIFTGADSQYLIGKFDGHHFTIESGPFAMDNGLNFYAAQVYSNLPATQKRTVQIGWMRGGHYPGMPFNQQMSFPCELQLRALPGGLRVCRQPVREIQALWHNVRHLRSISLTQQHREFPQFTGNQLDIEVVIKPGGAKSVAIEICGQHIEFNFAARKIKALGTSAAIMDSADLTRPLRIRILVDRTSIEVFAPDNAVSLSSCYLPQMGKSRFTCYTLGGKATLESLTVREVISAW
jgi:fructan beta-fructosidase